MDDDSILSTYLLNDYLGLFLLILSQAAGMIRPLSSTVVAQLCDGFLDHSLDR